jgi:hypothetical protein
MKIGLILECTKAGPDEKVYSHWIREQLGAATIIEPSCCGNKKVLINEAGQRANALFAMGCDKVLIIWDYLPPWKLTESRPSVASDKKAVANSLRGAKVANPCVYVICVKKELETLLIVDGAAIGRVLEVKEGKGGPGNQNKPATIADPKDYLTNLFQKHSRRAYTDYVHAEALAKAVDFERVCNKCPEASDFRAALHQTPCAPPLAWTP